MGLETFTYITSLNASNPVGATDPKSQGDDHLRGVKTVLLNSFPSITGAVTVDQNKINQTCVGTGGTFPAINGSALTSLNASNIASGTLADARLSANVPLLNAANVFSAGQSQVVSGQSILAVQSTTAARSALYLYTAGANLRAAIAAPGLTNDVITGDALGDLDLRIQSGALNVSVDGGTSIAHKLTGAANTTTFNGIAVSDFARLSQANVFTQSLNGLVRQTTQNTNTNASASADWRVTCGTVDGFLGVTGQSNVTATWTGGPTVSHMYFGTNAANPLSIGVNGVEALRIDTSQNFNFKGGTVTRNNASAAEVGNAGYIRRNVSATGSTNATDAHGAIVLTGVTAGQTFTLNANPPVDSVLLIVNESSQNWTIAASGTLTKDGATGSFTLAAGWMLWVFSDGSGNWRSTSAL